MNRYKKHLKPRTLVLTKETIAHLSDDLLKNAAGGVKVVDESGMSNCWPCPPTKVFI
jgi:hypothetical protein